MIKAVPAQAMALHQPLLNAYRDSHWGGREAAVGALNSIGIEGLMELFWATQSKLWIKTIVWQLFQTSLVVHDSLKSDHRRLVSYTSDGQSVEWTKSWREVEPLVQQIERARDEMLKKRFVCNDEL